MKALLKKMSIVLASVLILSCSKEDDANTPSSDQNLGTFAGNFQVTDDPQTNLGYVFNTNVTVTKSGSNATITITGNDGFNREYTGTITGGSSSTTNMFALTRQTKPVDKSAAGTLLVSNNELAFDLGLASDAVMVRSSVTGPTFTITGKIQMIGTNFLKQ